MSLTDLKYAKEENAKLKQKVEAVRKSLRDFDNKREAAQGMVPCKSREHHADELISELREILRHNAGQHLPGDPSGPKTNNDVAAG